MYFRGDVVGTYYLTQDTVKIHDGCLTDVSIVLDMLHTVLAHNSILLAFVNVQDARGQYHQIHYQQECPYVIMSCELNFQLWKKIILWLQKYGHMPCMGISGC